jgi:hypothetical protein
MSIPNNESIDFSHYRQDTQDYISLWDLGLQLLTSANQVRSQWSGYIIDRTRPPQLIRRSFTLAATDASKLPCRP